MQQVNKLYFNLFVKNGSLVIYLSQIKLTYIQTRDDNYQLMHDLKVNFIYLNVFLNKARIT